MMPDEFLLKEHVFLDTETTGVGFSDEIVEICIVNEDGGVVVDTLVKPAIKIPDGATAVHGIGNDMVRSAPTWPEIWPEIRDAIANCWIGVYNAEFDLRLITQTHARCGMNWTPIGAMGFCIMKLYARFHGDWDDYHGSYTWQSLADAAVQCGIDLPNTHRAKDDTLLAREILHYVAREVAT